MSAGISKILWNSFDSTNKKTGVLLDNIVKDVNVESVLVL